MREYWKKEVAVLRLFRGWVSGGGGRLFNFDVPFDHGFAIDQATDAHP